jgi:hypothetical protein
MFYTYNLTTLEFVGTVDTDIKPFPNSTNLAPPETEPGCVVKFIDTAWVNEPIVVSESELIVLKAAKKDELLNLFEEQFKNGKFMSSLGFEVDNRRYGSKNDKDNLLSLIDLGIYFFKDANNATHTLTLQQMLTLKAEMSADGLQKYNKKWNFESLIASCVDKTELDNLNIVF